MLNVFVLEDDLQHQTRIEQAIHLAVKKYQLQLKSFEIFSKPAKLLASITERGDHNLFFLDLEIKGEEQKGFDVAEEIRRMDPRAAIVFVTTHSEFLPLTLKRRLSALEFLDKGQSDQEFCAIIGDIMAEVDERAAVETEADFVFTNAQNKIVVKFNDILYFETSPTIHKVILYTINGEMEFYGKVSEIARTDTRLYQTYRSYVVNPRKVKRIDKKQNMVELETGVVIPVSRTKIKGLMKLMEELNTC